MKMYVSRIYLILILACSFLLDLWRSDSLFGTANYVHSFTYAYKDKQKMSLSPKQKLDATYFLEL